MEGKIEHKKQEEVQVKRGSIDKDVLNIMNDDEIMASIEDDKMQKRFILNCFCEFLSQIKDLKKKFDEFSDMIAVCSADKLNDFFKNLQENVEHEEKVQKLKEKMAQSHKKPKKGVKKTEKSVK